MPKPTDVARQLIEENIAVVLRPHFLSLGYSIETRPGERPVLTPIAGGGGGAMMYGESKDGEVVPSPFEDIAAQIDAAEKLLDRIYGRPKATVDAQVRTESLEVRFDATDPEARDLLGELLRGRPAT